MTEHRDPTGVRHRDYDRKRTVGAVIAAGVVAMVVVLVAMSISWNEVGRENTAPQPETTINKAP